MPIIDPGTTVIDDLGRPLLSPRALHLTPPNIGATLNPTSPPAVMGGISNIAPTPQSLGQTPQQGPVLNQKQGDSRQLPTYSNPSDIYKAGVSEMPQRNDTNLQHHGARKLLDIFAGIQGFPRHGISAYEDAKNQPYNNAMNDWQTKLAALKPELEQENVQTRERGERERAAASLASTDEARKATEAHQKAVEELTERQREETERRDAAAQEIKDREDKARQRRDELTETLRKQTEKREQERADEQTRHNKTQEDIETKRLSIEAKRLNKEEGNKEEGDKGTWSVEKDDAGKPFLFNNKTRETAPVPTGGINKPGDMIKADAKLAPLKAASDYANDYLAAKEHTGSGDEALLEKFFELAKPSSGFRMTQPQMQMLQHARSWTEGLSARARHTTTGTWFSDEQREQIVKTINDLAAANGIKGPENRGPQVQAPVKINSRRDAN